MEIIENNEYKFDFVISKKRKIIGRVGGNKIHKQSFSLPLKNFSLSVYNQWKTKIEQQSVSSLVFLLLQNMIYVCSRYLIHLLWPFPSFFHVFFKNGNHS